MAERAVGGGRGLPGREPGRPRPDGVDLTGDRRANAAKDYLASLGVDASRIQTVSYGKERPFATGHDEDSWQKNRRAHFVVTAK